MNWALLFGSMYSNFGCKTCQTHFFIFASCSVKNNVWKMPKIISKLFLFFLNWALLPVMKSSFCWITCVLRWHLHYKVISGPISLNRGHPVAMLKKDTVFGYNQWINTKSTYSGIIRTCKHTSGRNPDHFRLKYSLVKLGLRQYGNSHKLWRLWVRQMNIARTHSTNGEMKFYNYSFISHSISSILGWKKSTQKWCKCRRSWVLRFFFTLNLKCQ